MQFSSFTRLFFLKFRSGHIVLSFSIVSQPANDGGFTRSDVALDRFRATPARRKIGRRGELFTPALDRLKTLMRGRVKARRPESKSTMNRVSGINNRIGRGRNTKGSLDSVHG